MGGSAAERSDAKAGSDAKERSGAEEGEGRRGKVVSAPCVFSLNTLCGH